MGNISAFVRETRIKVPMVRRKRPSDKYPAQIRPFQRRWALSFTFFGFFITWNANRKDCPPSIAQERGRITMDFQCSDSFYLEMCPFQHIISLWMSLNIAYEVKRVNIIVHFKYCGS